jgi:hypothetical protein
MEEYIGINGYFYSLKSIGIVDTESDKIGRYAHESVLINDFFVEKINV